MKSVNSLRRGAKQGTLQVGTWITMVREPAILPLLKAVGMDFVRVDMEHTAMSIETIGDMALMARAVDLPMVVRPPTANREWITRLLDIGIWNILCPQVETAEQAAAIVAATRYAPAGLRGIGGLGAMTDFRKWDSAAEQRAHANDQLFVTVMLETGKALQHLEEIAALDGIDAVTLGPGDLAQDLGILGTDQESRVIEEKRAEIVKVCGRHRKVPAMLVSCPEQARQYREAGVKMITYMSDVEILHSGFSDAVTAIRTAAAVERPIAGG